jgi:hypothetical protein
VLASLFKKLGKRASPDLQDFYEVRGPKFGITAIHETRLSNCNFINSQQSPFSKLEARTLRACAADEGQSIPVLWLSVMIPDPWV